MDVRWISTPFEFAAAIGGVFLLASILLPGGAFAQDGGDATSGPNLRPAGFLHLQSFTEHVNETSSAFSVRRARFGFAGSLREDIHVNLVAGGLEPPDRTPRLVNAFVDLEANPLLTVRAGQFLVPFGREGPNGIVSNPAIERSLAIRRMNDATLFRDVGVQVRGAQEPFSYVVAVVNGTGANTAETINPKDLVGRVAVELGPAEIGLSGQYGERSPSTRGADNLQRLRYGVDVEYDEGPAFVQAEYSALQRDVDQFNKRLEHGGYLLGGYRFAEGWEIIGRVEMHDPQVDVDGDRFIGATIGPTFKFVGQTELALNYEIRDDQTESDLQHLLLVQLQAAL